MKLIEKKSKTDKSLRVTQEIRAKIIKIQHEHWDKTGEKITVPQVIDNLLRNQQTLIQQTKPARSTGRYPYLATNRELHDKLEQILNSGDRETLNTVVPNIELFFSRLRPAAGGADE